MAVSLERSRVEVPGGSLAVTRAGEGPAVVFLHGLGLNAAIWEPQLEALAPRQLAIAFDQRGHGQSSAADTPYARHDDVVAVLDALSVRAAHLVGSSMGGEVALDTALAHPSRVRSLLLLSPALGGFAWSPRWRDSMRAMRDAANAGGPAAAKEAWWAHALFAPARAREESRERLRAAVFADAGRRWSERDPAIPLEPPAAARLDQVRCPTTILIGEDDLADFHAIARTLAAGIPHARLRTIKGGHLPMIESPAETAALLGEILDAAPPSA
ncbi:MAG: alpha/beta hydrolase [Candidatus Eisenbacteria bacterium]